MSAGESPLNPEQLPPISRQWLEDAYVLVASQQGTEQFRRAERLYVLSTITKVDAAATGELPDLLRPFTTELNSVYDQGLAQAGAAEWSSTFEHTPTGWLRYMFDEVYAKIADKRTRAANYFELMDQAHADRNFFID